MGFRFRRSVTLCKGVRLNFGKTGMSISSGIPGFRKTYNLNTGRTTTSIGIPGSGMYYTTTSGTRNQNRSNTQKSVQTVTTEKKVVKNPTNVPTPNSNNDLFYQDTIVQSDSSKSDYESNTIISESIVQQETRKKDTTQITYETINSIFMNCDVPINWLEVASNVHPTRDDYYADTWEYLHKNAVAVLSGDIDTFLQIIKTVNPFDDLLDYAEDFEIGFDDDDQMAISFSIIPNMAVGLSHDTLNDYVSAVCIRVIRDAFSVLPVEFVKVEASFNGNEIINVNCMRNEFSEIITDKSDASDIIMYFANK